MDRLILAVFQQASQAEAAMNALMQLGIDAIQVQCFAAGTEKGTSDANAPSGLQQFLSETMNADSGSWSSVEKYMAELGAGSMLLGVRIGSAQAGIALRLLDAQQPNLVQMLDPADGQPDWLGLVPPDDDRSFERPNREAEMESIGERYGPSDPAALGRERRSGQERRRVQGRRAEDRNDMRIR